MITYFSTNHPQDGDFEFMWTGVCESAAYRKFCARAKKASQQKFRRCEIPGKGLGIVATADIPKNTVLAVCKGVFLPDSGFQHTLKAPVHIFNGKKKAVTHEGHIVLRPNCDFNMFNHQCSGANCKFHRHYICVGVGRAPIPVVMATRKIKAGAELTVSYNIKPEDLEGLPTVPCCCRGFDANGNAKCPKNTRIFDQDDDDFKRRQERFWEGISDDESDDGDNDDDGNDDNDDDGNDGNDDDDN